MALGNDPRLVIFDVDGTLIDSQHHILDAMATAFAASGQPLPPRDAVLGIVGLSLPEAMAVLAPHLSEGEWLALADAYRNSFVSVRTQGALGAAPLYPGARDALDRLAAAPATRLGVATGKARRGLDHVFGAHALAAYFVTSQTSDDHPSKPHPSMVLRALQDAGVEAGRAVMVGDTEFDIAMGRAAGVATVGVCWGYHPRERLLQAGADVLVDDFAGLDAALEAIWTRG